MSPFRLICGLLVVSAFGADSNLNDLLQSVQDRYNHAKTLQVLFKEQYTRAGKAPVTESGLLMLRKPGRMRWDYSQPKGKLVLSDGSALWIYNPAENRAEKMPLKQTEDMRAPMAFLLGKLNFQKDFRNIQGKAEGLYMTRITAQSNTESLPYSSVEFLVTRDSHIQEVKVTYYDKSVLDLTFDQERLDPSLDSKLFVFHLPPGVQLAGEQ
ncbi:MAG: outer membrane lipoprotein carrier protein LolA [Candidatus Sulfopaludibacter sp.]|nr:outer membrane lipoprotein carrier protein LolA [Candidatus Sulfopaludibacter sp.]